MAPTTTSGLWDKLRRLPYTLWAFVFIGLVTGGGYGAVYWRRQAETPRIASGPLIEALDRAYRATGSLPPTRDALLMAAGSLSGAQRVGEASFQSANYLYIYRPLDRGRAALWAFPLGRRRAEGQTYFIVARSGVYEIWKGPTLPELDSSLIGRVTTPTYEQLRLWGFALSYTSAPPAPPTAAPSAVARQR